MNQFELCLFFAVVVNYSMTHRVITKSKPSFITVALEVARPNRILSNLVRSVSDQCLTMWRKNYPLHLTYVCTLPRKVTRSRL